MVSNINRLWADQGLHTFKHHRRRHAHAGTDLVVDHAHQRLQVVAALGGAQVGNQLLLFGDGEEPGRNL
jgi:hypothetical protein